MRPHLTRHLLCLSLAIAAVGCSGLPAATITPATDPTPTTPQATTGASPGDCITLYESIDAAEPTLENLGKVARDVVIATVLEKGAPYWDSPTGKRPEPGAPIGEGNEYFILTPYMVVVDQAITGSRASGRVTVAVEGGEIGCDRFVVSPSVTMHVAQRYALFLRPWEPGVGEAGAAPPLAFEALPVGDDGAVKTPLDGAMSLPEFAAAVAATAP